MWGFDFSQIEARVLAWLAGQQDVLSVFQKGDDVYVWAAAQFGSQDRQLGKVLVLALGFGMGATKLRETARKNYGVTMSPGVAEKFKNEWRQRNSRIVSFWYEIENMARAALIRRGTVFAVGGSGIAVQATSRTLQMRLPSGRVLYYHKPKIDVDGSLAYWGPEVGGMWSEQRTYGGKLAENVTQAVARDIMASAMLRVAQRLKRAPMMTVHDELVYRLETAGTLRMTQEVLLATEAAALEAVCLESPPWAGGLPIAGEAKLMTRYGVLA